MHAELGSLAAKPYDFQNHVRGSWVQGWYLTSTISSGEVVTPSFELEDPNSILDVISTQGSHCINISKYKDFRVFTNNNVNSQVM